MKRTRRILGEALIKLLQEYDLKDISIRQITDKADVAYSTFFRHFDSPEALLLSHLYDFINNLESKTRSLRDVSYRDQVSSVTRLLFQTFAEEPDLPRVLFQNFTAQPVLKAFKTEQIEFNLRVITRLKLQIVADCPPLDMVVHNIIVQLFGLIEWWIEKDMQLDPERMALYYIQMVLRPAFTQLIGYKNMLLLFDE